MSARASGPGAGRRGRTRKASTKALVAIAVAISAVCMITLTARALLSRATCPDQPTVLNVAVSYDIAPAVQAIARTFNSRNNVAGGRCVTVQVTEGDSAAEAGQIDGQDSLPGATPIDAWIPDSSLWVDVARSYPVGAQVVRPTGTSVARSPLMIVTSRAIADRTHVFDFPVGWNVLLPPSYGGPPVSLGLATDLPDPTDSSAGLAALIEVRRDLGYGPAARTALAQFVFTAEPTGNFDSVSGLRTFVASTRPPFDWRALTVASEQAVVAYDRADPRAPLAARYPAGESAALGSQELDYPYVLTTAAPAPLAAARDFGRFLTGGFAAAEVRYYGFRSASGAPDVLPGFAGLSSQPLELASVPGASEAAASLQLWQQLGLGSRDLALIDASAAMSQPDGNGSQTLEQELTQTAARGLALFPDSTRMGLWEMGTHQPAARPYDQLVPLGPLPADLGRISRRARLQQIIRALTASSGTLALHDAILAAYQHMTATFAPGYANAVLVLTAGVDSAHGDISLASLLGKLRGLYNPSRKVEIVVIQFGRKGNFSALTKITGATGGVAYQISNPAEVGKIFIEAIAHRMCDQGCVAP